MKSHAAATTSSTPSSQKPTPTQSEPPAPREQRSKKAEDERELMRAIAALEPILHRTEKIRYAEYLKHSPSARAASWKERNRARKV